MQRAFVASLVIAFLGLVSRDALAQRQQRDPGIPVGFSPTSWAVQRPIAAGFYRLPGTSPDYRVGPGDELEVFITGYSSKSVSVKVSQAGDITIPLVGAIAVSDLTTTEVEGKVAAALKGRQLLQQPEVLVHVAEHLARPIYIIGQVDNPGQYMMSQQLTLSEAVLIAGGIDFTAGRYGYLHRRVLLDEAGPQPRPEVLLDKPEMARPGTTVQKIDLQPLVEGGMLTPDIPLRAGDVLVVPSRTVEMFYVIGDVLKAGGFEIPEQRTMRISQALAYGGGPTATAKPSKGMLVRYESGGQRREVPFDFPAIVRGEKEDFEVMPNDVIFIPGAGMKTVAHGLLRVVPGIIQTALIF